MSHSKTSSIEQKQISLLWAGPETALEIAKIQAELEGPRWTKDDVQELLANPCSNSLLVKVREKTENPAVTAGYIMARMIADEVEILAIGVLKPFQKFGLGRGLIEGLIRAAKRAEASKMFLEVAHDNAPAIALYDSLGFIKTGRREAYYKKPDGNKVDALMMTYTF